MFVMPQADGGYLGPDIHTFVSAVFSGAAGVYIFMLDRDAILIVGDGGAVYHHGNSVEAVFEKIRELGRTTPAAINESLNLPSAITCEILGWLERDGRVQLEDDTNHVSVA